MKVMQMTWNRLFVRTALTVALITCGVALLPVAEAGALAERPLCQVCRRYVDTSPSRVQAYLDYSGRTRVINCCSLFCLYEQLEELQGTLKWAYVPNYATIDDPEALPLKAGRSWFVYDADEGADAACHLPYIYAFRSQSVAEEYVEDLGGEVLEWDAVVERIIVLTDEWEPEPRTYPGRNSYRR